MPLPTEVICERLEKLFSNETQAQVGEKLHLSQGVVSKILSGAQPPTLETVNTICDLYGVSADWIMGRSDEITGIEKAVSYTEAANAFLQVALKEVNLKRDWNFDNNCLPITDPLLLYLIKKGRQLYNVDTESYNLWRDKKLALFKERELISSGCWQLMPDEVPFAYDEQSWIKLYEKVVKKENEIFSNAPIIDSPDKLKEFLKKIKQ